MEWTFSLRGEFGPCPGAKVEELTDFLISNKYVPFSWEFARFVEDGALARLNTSKHGRDWLSDAIVWLHQPSMPDTLAKNETITFNFKVPHILQENEGNEKKRTKSGKTNNILLNA